MRRREGDEEHPAANQDEDRPLPKFRMWKEIYAEQTLAKILRSELPERSAFFAEGGPEQRAHGEMPALPSRISRENDTDDMSSNNHNPILTPELKGWLDRVIVPALVRQYLARLEPENSLASESEPTVEFASAHTAIEGER